MASRIPNEVNFDGELASRVPNEMCFHGELASRVPNEMYFHGELASQIPNERNEKTDFLGLVNFSGVKIFSPFFLDFFSSHH